MGKQVRLSSDDTVVTCDTADGCGMAGTIGVHGVDYGRESFTLEIVAEPTNWTQHWRGGLAIGVAEADTDLNDGSGPKNIVCYGNGTFLVYENQQAAIQGFGQGDRIRVDIDFDSEQIFFFKNGDILCKADGIRRGVTLFPFASVCAGGTIRLIRVSTPAPLLLRAAVTADTAAPRPLPHPRSARPPPPHYNLLCWPGTCCTVTASC